MLCVKVPNTIIQDSALGRDSDSNSLSDLLIAFFPTKVFANCSW